MASASEVFVYKPDKWQKPRDFLAQHLPYSVPLLRCLQYFTHGTEAVLISSFDVEISEQPIAFALAFFDHQLPAVRSWIFSSLEIPSTREIENALDDRNSINDLALECLRKVFASMRTSCKDPTMLVGSVMSIVADALRRGPLSDAIRDDLSDAALPYGKFMLRDTQITAAFDLSLADGYAFDKVEARDYDLVLQNNKLIRSAQDLIGRPGVGIRDNNTGKLQACKYGRYNSTSEIYMHYIEQLCGVTRCIEARAR